MALVSAKDFQLVPDIQGVVGQGIQTAGQLQQLQGISQARDVNEQTQLLTGQILDQSLPPAQRAEAQRQLTALNPQATQQLQQVQAGEQKALSQQDEDQLRSIAQGALQVQALPTDDAKLGFLRRRRAEIVERGGNTTETDNVINLFETGQTDIANQQISQAVDVGQRLGFIGADPKEAAALKREEINARKAIAREKVPPEDTTTKERIKANVKRLSLLSTGKAQRKNSTVKAKDFLSKFEKGEVESGAARGALGIIPGAFTAAGRFDELFDSFAEVAAREKLKSLGEIRPTDADVKGMKASLFGPGRDEETNIRLLKEFISSQDTVEQEFKDLRKASGSNTLGSFTPTGETVPLLPSPEQPSPQQTVPAGTEQQIGRFTVRAL